MSQFYNDWAELHGVEVGTCNIHKIKIIDRDCPQCEDEHLGPWEWICGECGEYRPDDARVQGGMKCGECAYG